jgi:hypothetical protein
METILILTLGITTSLFIFLTVLKDRKDYFDYYGKKSI